MKIVDTSASLRFSPSLLRTGAGSTDEGFTLGGGFSQPERSAVTTSNSSSRSFASTLSGLSLDAAEPSVVEKAKASGKAAEAEFGKWAKMSPAEKIRALILEQHGLTEESFRELPKEMREEIEKEIQEAIKRQYGLDKQTGAATSEAETPTTAPPTTEVPAQATVQAE